MKQPLIISVFVLLGLLSILAFIGSGDSWPAVEDPPRQGEAIDSDILKLGRIEHSAIATARLVREPQNTWSNLAFVFAGSCLASFTTLRSSRLVGVALIAVGVGSFLYHASASRTLRHLDVGAMYGLFFVIWALAAAWFSSRLRACFESRITLLWFAAAAFAVFATFSRNIVVFSAKPLALSTVTAVTSTILVGVLILLTLKRRSIHVLLRVGLVIVLFSSAVICQVGDRPGGWLFNPESVVQAHSLWHILSASAVFVAVRVIDADSEPNKAPEPTPIAVTPRAPSSTSRASHRRGSS